MDMVAHSYQAMVVQPKLAASHVAPWLLNGPQPLPTTPTKGTAKTSAGSDDVGEGLLLGAVMMLARKLVG
jgi:hypothetical protein